MMTSSIEIQARSLTAQLSKAESDINQAAQNLENTFRSINDKSKLSGGAVLPDPIKLIKRITALEIALSNLQDECARISKKRHEIVQNVLSCQCETVSRVKEILEKTEDHDPYSSRDEIVDETWDSITRNLEKQMTLVQPDQEGSSSMK